MKQVVMKVAATLMIVAAAALMVAAGSGETAAARDVANGSDSALNTESANAGPAGPAPVQREAGGTQAYMPEFDPETHGVATLGGGCFWCVEAVYRRIDGITDVVSGYSGGHVLNPTYGQVTTGRTGHAEVVQILYDRSVISYREILDWFFRAHDPTTLNRQGNDIGPHYRSIILHHDDEQRQIAREFMQYVQRDFADPIVTELVPFEVFYRAEEYHQDYYARNPFAGYCVWVIRPKLESLGLGA